MNLRRRSKRGKKGSKRSINYTRNWLTKILTLTESLNPIPFIPKALDLRKHEDVLKRLGLFEFSKIEFDRSIRTDLIVQLIVNYDSKKRSSYVNGKRIYVNRADLARALKLDCKVDEVDLGCDVYTDEEIGFIEDFVFNWLLLHEEAWVMPKVIVNWTRCIRDGHPEKLDSASLVWYKVEKELRQKVKLVDSYYASHLQCLIRSQHGEVFEEDDGGGVDESEDDETMVGVEECKEDEDVKEMEELVNLKNVLGDGGGVDEEHKEEVSIVKEDDVEEIVYPEVSNDGETMVGVEELEEEAGNEMDELVKLKNVLGDGGGIDEEHKEKVYVAQEDDVVLNLGSNVEQIMHQEVRKDDEIMVGVEECKEEEAVKEMEEHVNLYNVSGDDVVADEEHTIVQEDDAELNFGSNVEEIGHQEVRKNDETMVDVEECKEGEVEDMEEQTNSKNVLGDGGGADEKHKEKVCIVQEDGVELTLEPDVVGIGHQEVRKNDETMVDVEDCKEGEVNEMEEHVNLNNVFRVDEEHEKKVSIVEVDDVDLTLEPDVEEIVHEEVNKDDEPTVDVEDCEEEVDEQGNWKNVWTEHILKRCQSSGLNVYKEIKDEEVEDDQPIEIEDDQPIKVEDDQPLEVEDEQPVEVEDDQPVEVEEEQPVEVEDDQPVEVEDEQPVEVDDEQPVEVEDEQLVDVEDEQIEQVEIEDDEVEVDVEGVVDRFVEGFDMEVKYDSMDRDGLTGNFLQGVQTSDIPYGSHGACSMDVFESRDDSFMPHDGSSFFNNGGKRAMKPEEDMHHHDGNSKRLKPNEMWDQKQNDFGSCMVQMEQWMEKAKMIHASKVESYVKSKSYQESAMDDLQGRQQVLEMIVKLRDEEIAKKNDEVFRLERELYLMGDLLAGYRKALNDMRFKFSEYRRRCVIQEEPLYKDAGPGGLVLSTRELEKQRLKQEENMMKLQTLLKSFEAQHVYLLEIQGERALKMAEKLVFVGNEVERLKEIATQRKETQKPRDELELSTKPEKNQKDDDDVPENYANMESMPPDADVSKEKGGSEEH
ncbi:hypothetical protein QVD17_33525 [Tagetes erecta]|uniref:Uncharacterized protein n=1 Tax=Tagetes erecta TaxID=13708 RepID=A0AAD8JYH3_TARER|nr:hypothetical protein QVD17_33525 [Tagetes erecta]